ncbi:MAG TPA: sulfurtransferase TusA family protein [Spirochaetota bacterium]|mgnify:CR=1 FL=1|nr:sulfurtransferase TusA family protein [Spirochaetota bacterium]HNT10029.1 sulfurtransferase TusA family protein [Spirochaetota bacterium]HNV48067.1 sulfurtransferase TusA family protein [Spirochaetota bacterium]HOS40105.1 sulfurtransferase TusA family protein [Spirochaetota bacterium]HPU87715.1 sulfurtransferase TusA family protein [Spirochaetota bacterium]
MAQQIDARGLSCPQPVVLTQQAIADGERSITVTVSSSVSKENVIRILERNGYTTDSRDDGDDIVVSGNK